MGWGMGWDGGWDGMGTHISLQKCKRVTRVSRETHSTVKQPSFMLCYVILFYFEKKLPIFLKGWNPVDTYNTTAYLGASTIRDSVPDSSDYNIFATMYAAGIKLNAVASCTSNITGLKTQIAACYTSSISLLFYSRLTLFSQSWVEFVNNVPGMLATIEGFNEINNFGFTYNEWHVTLLFFVQSCPLSISPYSSALGDIFFFLFFFC
jgi:hypothetical protein